MPLDFYTLLILLHGIGAVLGVGGATMSDLMFFKSIRNLKISKTELKFLELGSLQIWGGVILSLFSAASFWVFFPELVQNPRIYAKTTIFIVILLNGVLLNLWVTPFLRRHIDVDLATSESFRKSKALLFSSGALSIISWYYVFILGAWRGLEASYTTFIGIYALLIVSGVIGANIVGNYKLTHFSKDKNR